MTDFTPMPMFSVPVTALADDFTTMPLAYITNAVNATSAAITNGLNATITYGGGGGGLATGTTGKITKWDVTYPYKLASSTSDNNMVWYTNNPTKHYLHIAREWEHAQTTAKYSVWHTNDWDDDYATCTYNFKTYQWPATPPIPASDRLREIIASRSAPIVHSRQKGHLVLEAPQDIREQRARETLRRVIGDHRYRNFLAQGCVYARAKSGLVYQLYPGYNRTRVYKDGKLIETMCIVLRGNFPPTDTLIVRYLMVLNDEARFRATANISREYESTLHGLPKDDALTLPLPELFKRLKKHAA